MIEIYSIKTGEQTVGPEISQMLDRTLLNIHKDEDIHLFISWNMHHGAIPKGGPGWSGDGLHSSPYERWWNLPMNWMMG